MDVDVVDYVYSFVKILENRDYSLCGTSSLPSSPEGPSLAAASGESPSKNAWRLAKGGLRSSSSSP